MPEIQKSAQIHVEMSDAGKSRYKVRREVTHKPPSITTPSKLMPKSLSFLFLLLKVAIQFIKNTLKLLTVRSISNILFLLCIGCEIHEKPGETNIDDRHTYIHKTHIENRTLEQEAGL